MVRLTILSRSIYMTFASMKHALIYTRTSTKRGIRGDPKAVARVHVSSAGDMRVGDLGLLSEEGFPFLILASFVFS
jgi:hypothetical protein